MSDSRKRFSAFAAFASGPVSAICALSALVFAACDSSTSPAAPDPVSVKADLQVMADKITRLSPPNAKKMTGEGEAAKRAFKRSATDCVQEGMTVETGLDTSASGVVGTFEDTSYNYTAAGALVCGESDETSYVVGADHSKDAILESWFHTHMTMSFDIQNIFNFSFVLTGTGKVHYFSGYDLSIDALSVKGSLTEFSEYKMTLGLDGGKYTVPLAMAPGWDPMSDVEPAAGSVVMSGPIQAGGTTVGYFEVLGDDSVVIRDAAKAVVATHG